MSIIGYARVSTTDQNLDGQLAALKAAGAAMIFREKISGVRADRPQLKKMVSALRRGDLVIVTRLDRLGRSVRELLNLLAEFDKIGVGFRSLADVWYDTTTAHGRLILTVLGGLAERRPGVGRCCGGGMSEWVCAIERVINNNGRQRIEGALNAQLASRRRWKWPPLPT